MAHNKNSKGFLGVAMTGIAAGIAVSTLADQKTRKKIIEKISDFKDEYLADVPEKSPKTKSTLRKM